MNERVALVLLLTALAGYLLGGLNGAIIISKCIYHEDIRKKGSGNAGLTNFYRNYGALQTLPVLLIDVCKTVAACLIGHFLLRSAGMADLGRMLGGTAAVAGHMFPAYYGFHGGKGILSGATLAACMDWRCFLIVFGVFVVLVVLTKYVSLGSVCGCVALPLTVLWRFWGQWAVFAMAVLVGGLAIFMHRGNLQRLAAGNERKLKLHK